MKPATELFPRQEDSLEAGNILVSALEPRPEHRIHVHDESLRDGEQTVGVAFTPEVKIDLARRLIAAGVSHMSLGFPAVSEDEREVIRTIVREATDTSGFSCLSRATENDIRAVVDCEIPETALFIATSDIHLRHKLRIDADEAFRRMVDQVKLARSFGLRVRFALEDASRTPLERIERFAVGAMEAGAYMVTLCDTCGVLTPMTTQRLVVRIRELIGSEAIAVHFHNDLGMATANTLVALASGAGMAQGAIGGIGERAGNTCTEELIVALRVKYGLDLGVDLPALMALSEHVRGLVGFPKPPNRPILGDYVFAHESGIHVSGLMREVTTYEPFPPEMVGAEHSVWFGKHAGMANIQYVARRHGLEVSGEVAQATLEEVKRRRSQGARTDEELVRRLLEEGLAARGTGVAGG